MEKVARRASIRLTYEGTDISEDIAPMLVSLSCTDNASGKADDLEVTLENREGLWHGDWFPDQGAELVATIECENFLQPGETLTYPCGTYTIDEIQASYPPSRAVLRAVSSDIKEALRREHKTKAWENITLQAIAGDIADSHSLELLYDAPDVEYTRKDQRKESDLTFLARLTEEAGFRLKVAERQIIIYSGQEYDSKDPAMEYTEQDIASWEFRAEAHEVFSACRVSYWDPGEKIILEHTFRPRDVPESGQTLVVNERVESRAQAEKLAMAKLREANQAEVTGTVKRLGDPRVFAGNTLSLSGLGVFSGKYFIEQARHKYTKADGYSTEVSLRRTLEDY